MRFNLHRENLGKKYGWKTEAGEDIFIEFPIGVLEGFIQEVNTMRATTRDLATEEEKVVQARKANLRFLDLVTDWNVTDDAGKPLPLPKTLKKEDARLAVLAQLPTELISFTIDSILNKGAVEEKTQDFSNSSSEQPS